MNNDLIVGVGRHVRRHLTRRSLGGLLAAAVATIALTAPSAGAVTKGAYATVRFQSSIAGVETGLDGLHDVLVQHTSLAGGSPTKTERIVFVYGIGHGDKVFDAVVSETVLITPGKKPFISAASGPVDSAWDAFEDPALGFEDPALGFEDPALGFEDPALGFEDPALGFDAVDPQANLEAIWGNGNIGIDDDDYGLVLFTMSDPDMRSAGDITYSVAVVPFTMR